MPAGFDVALNSATGGYAELLTSCKFYFEAPGRVEQIPILEISGMSVECPPAGNNQVFGSGLDGVKLRQATPTTQKFNYISVRVAATEELDLYEWYKECNLNEAKGSNWANNNRIDSSITAYDQSGVPRARWEITLAYPYKYGGPEFKSGDDQIASELIEIVHEGIARVTI